MATESTTRIRSSRLVALAAGLVAVALAAGHTTPVLAATAIEYGLIAAL
jgi:Flp pilus assembly pilin Flp